MDKRKAIQASPTPDGDDRARKRRKQSAAAAATVQQNGTDGTSTQALGQGLLNAIMNHQERNRHVRQHFEKLPSQSQYPDYYLKIKNPISLHEIQSKLNNNQYATLQDVHSDLLLMCQNAAIYNKPKSQVHSDSIRVRNVIESYMAEQTNRHVKREDSTGAQPTLGRASRNTKTSPASLQQTQMQIVDDMMTLVDDQGEPVAHYFLNLPSKKLYGEYFRIIKQPISLNMIKKKISQGEYTKWSDFEYAVSLIKKNAEEFNDEGSDIVKDARRLNEYFIKRLAEGKAKAGDVQNGTPSGIKLRLNVGAHRAQSPQKQETPASTGPKIRLNVGNKQATNSTPVAAPPPQPTQKTRAPSRSPVAPSVSPITNGNSAAATPVKQNSVASVSRSMTPKKAPTPPTPTAVTLPPPVVSMAPVAAPTSLPVGGLVPGHARSQSPEKAESVDMGRSKSPQSETITLRATSASRTSRSQMSPPIPNTMPPPPQRLSATPAPGASHSQSPAPPLNVPVPAPPPHRQSAGYFEEPRYRAEGKDASSALITNFRIASAPGAPGEQKFTKDLLPDDHKVTTQFFLHLPPDCHTIVVTPTLSASGLSQRLYKLSVEHKTNNYASKIISPWAAQQKKKEEPPFEVRLNPGTVNTIECTLVTTAAPRAGMVNGVGGSPGGWELERFRVFVSLLPN